MPDAMLQDDRYLQRRAQLSEYFGATAARSWAALTSDAPTSFVRRSVRAGRDAMRAQLLEWLPARANGLRVLDAGCGTGSLAIELARRGATVIGVDVADAMIAIARERTPADIAHRVEFTVGDMADAAYGTFDHVVAMDSLIHYCAVDMLAAIRSWSERTTRSMALTVAPLTPALAAKHALGRLFPRSSRSPEIAPVSTSQLERAIAPMLGVSFALGRSRRVATGFYVSHAMEIISTAGLGESPRGAAAQPFHTGGTR